MVRPTAFAEVVRRVGSIGDHAAAGDEVAQEEAFESREGALDL
jgi:hypothetical protein